MDTRISGFSAPARAVSLAPAPGHADRDITCASVLPAAPGNRATDVTAHTWSPPSGGAPAPGSGAPLSFAPSARPATAAAPAGHRSFPLAAGIGLAVVIAIAVFYLGGVASLKGTLTSQTWRHTDLSTHVTSELDFEDDHFEWTASIGFISRDIASVEYRVIAPGLIQVKYKTGWETIRVSEKDGTLTFSPAFIGSDSDVWS